MNLQKFLLFLSGGAGGGPPVIALGSGDLTTAFTKWLAAMHFSGDINTEIRDELATRYAVGQNQDLTTLVARFDDHNLG